MKIKLENLEKKLDGNVIIENVNMEFESGNIYGLVGRNGSGKTMIMKCLCGFMKSKGDIIIDGVKVDTSKKYLDSVGVLIETPGFIEHYSAFDNLKELASIKKIASDDEIKELLNEVGLDWQDKKKVKKYSLGMRQKLGIAMAFLEEPELIILDEPFNALDEATEAIVVEMIKKRKEAGKLIIITCHDSSMIEELCSKVYKIENHTAKLM